MAAESKISALLVPIYSQRDSSLLSVSIYCALAISEAAAKVQILLKKYAI
jgi:hypothetical protein